MVDQNLLLEFNSVFKDEDHSVYLNRLKEIPSLTIIDFVSTFLRYRINDKRITDLQNLLSMWFRKENEDYANDLYKRIQHYEAANKLKVIVINEFTNLLILEAGLSNTVEKQNITDVEFEIFFFKVYLAFNQKSVENEREAGTSTKNFELPKRINALLIAQSLKYSDLTEYNLKDSFVIQIAKALYFFEEFSTNAVFKPLLESFYKNYEVDGYKDFIKKYLALSSKIFNAEDTGKIDILVSEGEDKDRSNFFLERFASPSNLDGDIDFKMLRSQPLIKIDENKYRIIFPLFVIEKLYNGLYFKLTELNDQLPSEKKVKNLRSVITYRYSEKQLLYKLMGRCYEKKYIQHSGESIDKTGISGFVDYYVRNGNKVFIYESKDILLNAEVKQSYSYDVIEKELINKLYFEENQKKIIAKAVLQLINSIKILLDGKFTPDPNINPNSIRIYPILVLHNRQLEILGFNQLIKSWFREEIKKLSTDYKIEKVKDIVVMNIDSLIIYSDQIQNKVFRLEDAIDSYSNFTNQDDFKKKKFKRYQNLSAYLRNSCISFSEYLRKTHKWKLPKIFEEKGYSLFS